MIRYLLLGLIVSLLFVSCSPSESSINTAIAQTQAANPTNTLEPTDTPQPTFTQTATKIPTNTPIPTDTPTTTPTASPTPDLRVISETSDKFLLEASDLPQDAKYFLPNSTWISPHHNSEIISAWGREEGLEYIEQTGRIDGWFVYFKRGTRTVRAPDEISHNIVQYKSSDGAQLVATDFNISTRSDNDWRLLEEDIDLGDLSLALSYKEMQPSGKYEVYIAIYTTYRNYLTRVVGVGLEDDISLDYMIGLAEIGLEKLESAELSEPNWPEE